MVHACPYAGRQHQGKLRSAGESASVSAGRVKYMRDHNVSTHTHTRTHTIMFGAYTKSVDFVK